jgi:predicted cupin superfamily sugar epimerase
MGLGKEWRLVWAGEKGFRVLLPGCTGREGASSGGFQVVEGSRYKATVLLLDRDEEEATSRKGMLASETVVPGFEYFDHEFLVKEGLKELIGRELARELRSLVKGCK